MVKYMFIELEKSKVLLSEADSLYLRYDNRAFLFIEKSGYKYNDLQLMSENGKAARVFLIAGLKSWAEEKGVVSEELNDIANTLLTEGSVLTLLKITEAILEAFPRPDNAPKNGNSSGEIGTLMTAYCDIMRHSEEDFWKATLREVIERWDRYAVMKGYKEPPILVKEFDE